MPGLIQYRFSVVEVVLRGGVFTCPECGPGRHYQLKGLRRYFRIYGIRIVPVGGVQDDWIFCTDCRGTFAKAILSIDPSKAPIPGSLEPESRQALLSVIVAALMPTAELTEEQRAFLHEVYESTTDRPLADRQLDAELGRFQSRGSAATVERLKHLSPRFQESERRMILRAAVRVIAEKEFGDEQKALLKDLAGALDIPEGELHDLVLAVVDED